MNSGVNEAVGRTQDGFTLIEIIVALVIFALVAITVSTRTTDIALQSRLLEERILASWIARDHLELLRAQQNITNNITPAGNNDRAIEFAGRNWRVRQQLRAVEGGVTGDGRLQAVQVSVFLEEGANETLISQVNTAVLLAP